MGTKKMYQAKEQWRLDLAMVEAQQGSGRDLEIRNACQNDGLWPFGRFSSTQSPTVHSKAGAVLLRSIVDLRIPVAESL
jgi:hypothetical protein